MSDEEILDKFIDLSKSDLSDEEKEEFMEIIKKYKNAFSLRDEIGECPNIKVDIDVIDESPFFVRPFPISEEDKPIMDWQMQRLVSLGILSKNTTSHTSPVMLITRKITKDKRPVVDFRLLNTRIKRHNTASPLLRDIYQMLGKSESDMLSCVDLKDAFHSLKLTDKAKDYCGILPYFGSPHYRYEVMPMGLSISPCKWIQYIGFVMEKMEHPSNYIAIMDDLLVHSKKKDHLDRIRDLLKALCEHGLKLSPKKCQFFKTELVYMGNVFKIKNRRFTITPIKTRVEAILNTPAPKTPKECKAFCGVVNYVSLFCPNLQLLLSPIYDLTRKGRPFVWTELHQQNFDKIKEQMASAPVLSLPQSVGRYILYSDTSKTHCGSALWQVQSGKPRLIGYASKSLPQAAKNYGITELEMTGLVKSMQLWRFYLKGRDFDAAVDHKAIPYIMKSKQLPTTDRIIRLLEALNEFTFHLYYVKGKDMILSDFLSRVSADKSNPDDLVPVAFNSYNILQAQYTYTTDNSFSIMTRKQAKSAGIAPPKVHGIDKGVNPNLKPEIAAKREAKISQPNVQIPVKTKVSFPSSVPIIKTPPKPLHSSTPVNSVIKKQLKPLTPGNTSGSTPFSTPMDTPFRTPLEIPKLKNSGQTPSFIKTPGREEKVKETKPIKLKFGTPSAKQEVKPSSSPMVKPEMKIPESSVPISQPVSVHPSLLAPSKITPIPIDSVEPDVEDYDPNIDVPLHDTSVEAMYRPPELKDFILPPSLEEYKRDQPLLSKHMPKQSEVDKLLKQLNRKILTNTRFPASLKDLEAAYNNSSSFRDVYNYLKYTKLPPNRRLARKIETTAQDYFVLGSLLFKYIPHKSGNPEAVLCIPPSKIDCILDYYHSSLLGGHQGMTKTLKTLSSRFYCPRLADYVRAYIVGCHVCQLFKDGKRFNRPFQKRIYDISTPALSHISMDIKHMPPSSQGHKFLLVMLCEITNFIFTHPMKKISAVDICTIIVDHFISYFSVPIRIICDQDPAFMASLTQYCFQQYGIKLITVSPTNHKSLQAEHGIKSISNLLITQLSGLGKMWHLYAKPCMLTYNSYISPNLNDLSPFELVFGRKARLVPQFEITPQIPVTGTFKDAKEHLDRKLKILRIELQKFKDKRYEELNKGKVYHGYTTGQLVYLFFPGNSMLQSGSKKFTCKFVGPLAIWKSFSPTQFVLMSLDGIIYPFLVEETRLKPGVIRTTKGNVYTLSALRQMIRSGYLLRDAPSYDPPKQS